MINIEKMNKNISDLKKWPKVYEAAYKNIEKFKSNASFLNNFNETYLASAFPWAKTEEGFMFWEAIWLNDIDRAKELQPDLFNEDFELSFIDKSIIFISISFAVVLLIFLLKLFFV